MVGLDRHDHENFASLSLFSSPFLSFGVPCLLVLLTSFSSSFLEVFSFPPELVLFPLHPSSSLAHASTTGRGYLWSLEKAQWYISFLSGKSLFGFLCFF